MQKRLLQYLFVCFISINLISQQGNIVQYNQIVDYLNECATAFDKSHTYFRTMNEALLQKDPSIIAKQGFLKLVAELKAHEPSINGQYKNILQLDFVQQSASKDVQDKLHKINLLHQNYMDRLDDVSTVINGSFDDAHWSLSLRQLENYSLLVFDYSALQYILYQELFNQVEQLVDNKTPLLTALNDEMWSFIFSLRRNDSERAKSHLIKVREIRNSNAFYDEIQTLSMEDQSIAWSSSNLNILYQVIEMIVDEGNILLTDAFETELQKENQLKRVLHYYNCLDCGGYTASLNQHLQEHNIQQIKRVVEPTWFTVVYPDLDTKTVALESTANIAIPNRVVIEKPVIAIAEKVEIKQEVVAQAPIEKDIEPRAAIFRPLNNFVLLIDVSSSMRSDDKLPLLKQTIEDYIHYLREDDKLTIITYTTNVNVIVRAASSANTEVILSAIDNIDFGGKTDGYYGLVKAYSIAKEEFIPKGINKIVLATDGKFSFVRRIKKVIQRNADLGVTLSVFGFGKRFNQETVENLVSLSVWGKGNFVHLNEESSAVQALQIEAGIDNR